MPLVGDKCLIAHFDSNIFDRLRWYSGEVGLQIRPSFSYQNDMGNSELHPSMSNDFFIYFSDGEFNGGKIINCGT